MENKKSQLKWGIITAGKICNDFVKALSLLPSSEHTVVAVASRSIDKCNEFAEKHFIPKRYSTYLELAQDPEIDVVYVGSINPQHYELSKMMLEHGKHVLCEKPLCMNLRETTELIKFAEQKKLFLMEGLWSRFFPAYKQLKILLESGTIGEVYHISVNFGVIITADRVKLKELGGGTILDLGVYVLQLAMFVFGRNPESMFGIGHLNSDNVDESVTYALKYSNGKLANMTTHSKIKMKNCATIYGDKGFIELVDPFWCPTRIVTPHGEITFPLPGGQEGFNFTNSSGLAYEAEEVRECIMNGLIESPSWSHLDSLTLARFQEDIRKSVGVAFPQDTV